MTTLPFAGRRRMNFKTFCRALAIVPTEERSRVIYDAALAEGITSVSEAKRVFVETRTGDLNRRIIEAQDQREENRVARRVQMYGPGVEDK